MTAPMLDENDNPNSTSTSMMLCLNDIDTGQLDIDTGQLVLYATEENAHDSTCTFPAGASLVVMDHEIHRFDESPDGRDRIISTLKYFLIHVALHDSDGKPITSLDGTALHSTLLYENGQPVQELSVTMEPPLLGGEAVLENGHATLRMRITVLSSLCGKRNFRVCVCIAGHPAVCAIGEPIKTITKLKRGSRETKAERAARMAASADADADDSDELPCGTSLPHTTDFASPEKVATYSSSALLGGGSGGKRSLEHASSGACLKQQTSSLKCALRSALRAGPTRGLDELWAEVAANGERLVELQSQQTKLFAELKALKAAREAREAREAIEAAAPAPVVEVIAIHD